MNIMTPQQALNNLAQAVGSNGFSAPLQTHQILQQSINILAEFIKPKPEEPKPTEEIKT